MSSVTSSPRSPSVRHAWWLALSVVTVACSADSAKTPASSRDARADSDMDGDDVARDASTGAADAGSARDAGTPRDAANVPGVGPTQTGASSGSDASAGPATSRPTECAGKPLPPRAVGKVLPPFAVGPESAGLPPYWPTAGWRSEDPEKLGFDATKLKQAATFSTPFSSTQAVFVVRHGYVALESYTGGFSATTQHES